jgi:RNA polymerase sigma factor (sigma-70 family)
MDIELLIQENLKLVKIAMCKLKLHGNDEAYSIGCEALYNAVLNFKHERGVKFSTYAYVCIYNALGMYIRKLIRERDMNSYSYDAQSFSEGDIIEMLPSNENVEDSLIRKEKLKIVYKILDDYIKSRVSNQQKLIVKKWIESDFKGKTIDIAEQVGVSQCYVSVTIRNTRAYLKKRMGVEYNEG